MTTKPIDNATMADLDQDPVTDPTGDAAPATVEFRILCVDDEPNILAALRRLFRNNGFSVRIADSAQAGIAILEHEPIDLVISDMRMPEMDGARFLGVVRERWPQTLRMLLTGHADAQSISEAVNSGQILRYITKPWDDKDLVAQVREALVHHSLERKRLRLEQLARSRTEELKALNSSLEQNINASKDELALANKRLKSNFVVSLKVFSSLIEARRPDMAGHARRVADLARRLAARLDLPPALVHEVFVAGLLHDVGKLGFTDELLGTAVATMTGRQLQQYRQHPARAEELLMPLQDLRGAAASIGAQLERYDGTGYPRQLRGREILVGARILAVCSDYDNLQIGVLAPRRLSAAEALGVVERSAALRYDPWVIKAFVGMLRAKPGKAAGAARSDAAGDSEAADALDDILVNAGTLVLGVVLSRDLISPSGLMMLPAGHVIDERLIQKLLDFEKSDGSQLTIYIRKPTEED